MIADSSALIAILREEPGYERLRELLILSAGSVRMASASYLETSIVVDAWKDPEAQSKLEDLIAEFTIEIVPFTGEHARVARKAYRDFGRGSGHPAKLNTAWPMRSPAANVRRCCSSATTSSTPT